MIEERWYDVVAEVELSPPDPRGGFGEFPDALVSLGRAEPMRLKPGDAVHVHLEGTDVEVARWAAWYDKVPELRRLSDEEAAVREAERIARAAAPRAEEAT